MRGIVKVVIGGLIVLAIIVIAAVAINLFVSSGGHTTSATSDLRTYTNSQYRFAVSYDADRVTEDTTELPTQGPTPDFVTLLHFTGGYGGVWLIYGLTQRKVDAAYLRGLLRRSVRSYAGYVRLGRIDPAVLGSLPGFETGGTIGKDFEYLTFAVGRGHNAYVISAQTYPAQWRARQATIFQILRSFHFTG
jgi:hypothetical protein